MQIPTVTQIIKIIRYSLLAFIIASISLVLLFRFVPLPTSMFMLYRHVEDISEGIFWQNIDYRWRNQNQISPYMYRAVIASEDQRFFSHFGFDFQEIQDSLEDYQETGHLRGASTISQQTAKNVFLIPVKSFIRKGLEVWFTLLIESIWSKERILTVYLNIAELGDHIFGIEAASQRYFGLSAKQLTPAQCALLAASLPNPLRLQVKKPTAYLFKRQLWILHQMRPLPFQQ
jgi:monofunctional biosynthetic peptidoglycan transglycosylase